MMSDDQLERTLRRELSTIATAAIPDTTRVEAIPNFGGDTDTDMYDADQVDQQGSPNRSARYRRFFTIAAAIIAAFAIGALPFMFGKPPSTTTNPASDPVAATSVPRDTSLPPRHIGALDLDYVTAQGPEFAPVWERHVERWLTYRDVASHRLAVRVHDDGSRSFVSWSAVDPSLPAGTDSHAEPSPEYSTTTLLNTNGHALVVAYPTALHDELNTWFSTASATDDPLQVGPPEGFTEPQLAGVPAVLLYGQPDTHGHHKVHISTFTYTAPVNLQDVIRERPTAQRMTVNGQDMSVSSDEHGLLATWQPEPHVVVQLRANGHDTSVLDHLRYTKLTTIEARRTPLVPGMDLTNEPVDMTGGVLSVGRYASFSFQMPDGRRCRIWRIGTTHFTSCSATADAPDEPLCHAAVVRYSNDRQLAVAITSPQDAEHVEITTPDGTPATTEVAHGGGWAITYATWPTEPSESNPSRGINLEHTSCATPTERHDQPPIAGPIAVLDGNDDNQQPVVPNSLERWVYADTHRGLSYRPTDDGSHEWVSWRTYPRTQAHPSAEPNGYTLVASTGNASLYRVGSNADTNSKSRGNVTWYQLHLNDSRAVTDFSVPTTSAASLHSWMLSTVRTVTPTGFTSVPLTELPVLSYDDQTTYVSTTLFHQPVSLSAWASLLESGAVGFPQQPGHTLKPFDGPSPGDWMSHTSTFDAEVLDGETVQRPDRRVVLWQPDPGTIVSVVTSADRSDDVLARLRLLQPGKTSPVYTEDTPWNRRDMRATGARFEIRGEHQFGRFAYSYWPSKEGLCEMIFNRLGGVIDCSRSISDPPVSGFCGHFNWPLDETQRLIGVVTSRAQADRIVQTHAYRSYTVETGTDPTSGAPWAVVSTIVDDEQHEATGNAHLAPMCAAGEP